MTADDRRPPLPPPAHPDLDTLADLHADALDGATAERVRAHASSCPRCAPVLAGLDTVRAELHALPTPRMPAAVAARLDATLADLRRGALHTGSTAAAGGAAVSAEEAARRRAAREADQLALARARRRHRLVRVSGAVAAAVAVLAAGASVTALVRSGTGNVSDSAGSAAGAGADSATQAGPGVAAAPGSPRATGLILPSYSQESLRTALPSIAQQSAVEIINGQGESGPAGVMADPARRTACAGTIRGSRGAVEAVLRIRYEGRPAYVFVFSDGGERTGFVVSEDCGTAPALPASVLDTVS